MTDIHAWTLIAQGQGADSFLVNLLPMAAIFAIFYFLLIAPMRKRQKKLHQVVENLKRGDKVITNGGIHGEVSAIDGAIIHVKVSDNTRLRVSRSAIAGLEGEAESGRS